MFVSKYVTSETNAYKYYNFDKSRYTNSKYIICNFILKKKKFENSDMFIIINY